MGTRDDETLTDDQVLDELRRAHLRWQVAIATADREVTEWVAVARSRQIAWRRIGDQVDLAQPHAVRKFLPRLEVTTTVHPRNP